MPETRLEIDDHPDTTGLSFDEAVTRLMAVLNGPNPKETFMKVARNTPKALLNGARFIEKESWAAEPLCLATEAEPELGIEISFELTQKELQRKIIASARKALGQSLQ